MSSSGGEHPYRERGDDVGRRIERLLAEVEVLHARITPSYWRHLDGELQGRLDILRPNVGDAEERERALEAHRDDLQHLIDDAPNVERWLTALPNSIAKGTLGAPWRPDDVAVMLAREWVSGSAVHRQSLAARLARWVGRLDPDAKLLHHALGNVRVSRFDAHGAPFALQADAIALDEDAEITIVTTVARAAPAMNVVEKGWTHSLGEALSLYSDAKTGDSIFDGRFFVRVDASNAIAMLSSDVRKLLAELAHFAPPTLSVRDGLARLQWRYLPLTEMLDRAVAILGALRHAKHDVELVSG